MEESQRRERRVVDVDPTAVITTPHLVLRRAAVADAGEMVEVMADRALYEFIGGEPPTLAELENRYQLLANRPTDSKEIWCNWIVRLAIDQRAVGFVQATVHSNGATLAWLIGVEYQGHNFASEAAEAVATWLVQHGVDQDKLTAHIHPDNRASQIVASRIGLVTHGQFDDDGEALWTSEKQDPDCTGAQLEAKHEPSRSKST